MNFNTKSWLQKPRKKSQGDIRLSSLFSRVCRNIRKNRWSFLLNCLVVGVAVLYVVGWGFGAFSIWLTSKEVLKGQDTKIIAKCIQDDRLDRNRRFTAERIREISRYPFVKRAIGLIDLNVYLGVEGGEMSLQVVESTEPGDPELGKEMISWGRGISDSKAEEIVVTRGLLDVLQRFYNQTTGKIEVKQGIPDFIRLKVTRSISGVEQPYSKNYRLVGVVDSSLKRAFLPLSQLQYLDVWLSGKIDEMPGSEEKISLLSVLTDSARAFVSEPVSDADLKEIGNHFGISYVKSFGYGLPYCSGTPRMRISRQDNQPLESSDLDLSSQPISSGLVAHHFVKIKRDLKVEEFGDFDAVEILAVSESDKILDGLKTESGKEISSLISKTGMVVLSSEFAEKVGIRKRDWITQVKTRESFMPALLEIGGVMAGDSLLPSFDLICSQETLDYVGFKVQTSVGCLVATSRPSTIKKLREKGHDSDIWEWDSSTSSSANIGSTTGSQLDKTKDPYLGMAALTGTAKQNSDFMGQFKDPTVKIVELIFLPEVELRRNDSIEDKKVAVILGDSLDDFPVFWRFFYSAGSRSVLISDSQYSYSNWSSKRSDFSVGGVHMRVEPVEKHFPGSIALISPTAIIKDDVFKDVLESGKFTRSIVSPACVDIEVANVWRYVALRNLFRQKGFVVTDLYNVKEDLASCLEIQDASGGKVDQQLINYLKADVTFLDVYPVINFEAKASIDHNSRKVSLSGSYSGDRMQFRYYPLECGQWIGADSPEDLVIPASLLAGSHDHPEEYLGRKLTLNFEKKQKRSVNEPPLSIACKLVGVVSGEVGYIPIDLANKISLWQEGRLRFDGVQENFSTPIDFYQGRGSLRCKVFADDIKNVRKVVDYLHREMNYDTDDSLKQQEALIFQAKLLLFLVFAVVVGSCFISVINVATTTRMNTERYIHEMGTLRSCGASNFSIYKMFFLQGLIMGVFAFLVAFGLSSLFVDVVLWVLEAGFQLDRSRIFTVSIYSPQCWFLHLAGLLIAVMSCQIGVLWSARLACKMSIIDTLKIRE